MAKAHWCYIVHFSAFCEVLKMPVSCCVDVLKGEGRVVVLGSFNFPKTQRCVGSGKQLSNGRTGKRRFVDIISLLVASFIYAGI